MLEDIKGKFLYLVDLRVQKFRTFLIGSEYCMPFKYDNSGKTDKSSQSDMISLVSKISLINLVNMTKKIYLLSKISLARK